MSMMSWVELSLTGDCSKWVATQRNQISGTVRPCPLVLSTRRGEKSNTVNHSTHACTAYSSISPIPCHDRTQRITACQRGLILDRIHPRSEQIRRRHHLWRRPGRQRAHESGGESRKSHDGRRGWIGAGMGRHTGSVSCSIHVGLQLTVRTFCRWYVALAERRSDELMRRLNVKLEMKGVEPMQDLVKDFSNGVKLIQLLVSSEETFARTADAAGDHVRVEPGPVQPPPNNAGPESRGQLAASFAFIELTDRTRPKPSISSANAASSSPTSVSS